MNLPYSNRALVVDDFARHVSRGKADFFRQFGLDFIPGERNGCFLNDFEGKAYLNCHCNGGVFNLGHRHPKIVAALKRALETWDIGNHHLISMPRAMLGRQLAELLPGDINQTVFGVGGGEAIDLALKLAKGITGRPNIISAKGGFHGHTGLALAAGDDQYRAPFGPNPPGFSQAKFGDIAALDAAVDSKTAAVILETIPATLGIVIPPRDYLENVRRICDRSGALMVIDEVQCGLGRTGRLWAIDEYDVVPDIVVIGKGLSGGIYPISATCYRDKFDFFFRKYPFIHISTFGGSELGCFPAMAVLEESSSAAFLQHVNEMAAFFSEQFTALQEKFPQLLIEIRQKGLMMGLKFSAEKISMGVCKMLYDNGVFAIFSGNDTCVIQFLPPLIIQKPEAEFAISALTKSLEVLQGMLGGK
ncbi:aspartate aminotransferase family protein [candidate division KSB1 bacterium]|nr:aspartate aminotransferase family protein [candidate division KSB1 bacterium]